MKVQINNPFPKSGFFATPSSIDELVEYCEEYSGSERTVAIVVMMRAINLAHDMFNKATKEETND